MKKKPNIKIGIIINIALTVLSIVYMFVYYIERNGFEFNYTNSLCDFIPCKLITQDGYFILQDGKRITQDVFSILQDRK